MENWIVNVLPDLLNQMSKCTHLYVCVYTPIYLNWMKFAEAILICICVRKEKRKNWMGTEGKGNTRKLAKIKVNCF